MRKLGIRIRRQSKLAPAFGAVEIFDIESGDSIGSFSDVELQFPINGAVQVQAKFYPEVVDVIEEKTPLTVDRDRWTGKLETLEVTQHSGGGYRQFIPGDKAEKK